jgi:hypothetical protein
LCDVCSVWVCGVCVMRVVCVLVSVRWVCGVCESVWCVCECVWCLCVMCECGVCVCGVCVCAVCVWVWHARNTPCAQSLLTEDRGSMSLWNVFISLQDCTMSQFKRLQPLNVQVLLYCLLLTWGRCVGGVECCFSQVQTTKQIIPQPLFPITRRLCCFFQSPDIYFHILPQRGAHFSGLLVCSNTATRDFQDFL